MSEKRGKKRSKSYYIKCAHGGKKSKHVNDLDIGMKGFLVTCNKYERETVREMYNILNEYADKLYGPEKPKKEDSDEGSDDEDMEKAMKKEAAEIKETTKDVRRFQNTDTKTKNLIFVRTTLDNPCELAHSILTDMFDSQVQKARYALRMLPIDATCKANVNQITETAKTVFKRDFETEFGVGLKFTSVCKIRNNNSVSRMAILPSLGRIVQELNPLHTLCHDEPDLVIVVEVIRNVCCLSVIKDYFKYKKYNLHEIVKTNDKDSDKFVKGEKSPEKTSESKNDANMERDEIKSESKNDANMEQDEIKTVVANLDAGAIEKKDDTDAIENDALPETVDEKPSDTNKPEKESDKDTIIAMKDADVKAITETTEDKTDIAMKDADVIAITGTRPDNEDVAMKDADVIEDIVRIDKDVNPVSEVETAAAKSEKESSNDTTNAMKDKDVIAITEVDKTDPNGIINTA